MTQGDPVPPTIFNIVVKAVVQTMMVALCGPQEAQYGLGWIAGDQYIVFYTNNGHIVGINSIWVQGTLTTLIRMFE